MANNFEKDFQRLEGNLKKIARALNDRSVQIRLARKCREIVYRRVKSGYGVTSDSDTVDNTGRQRLKPLSPTYVAYRKGEVIFRRTKGGWVFPIYNKRGTRVERGASTRGTRGRGNYTKIKVVNTQSIDPPKLGPFGRPGKSNLTLTGQMLESMRIRTNRDGWEIFVPDTKRTNPDGTPSKLTNKQVADYVSIKGRPFMALTEGEVRILVRECEKIISDKISSLIRN